MSSLSAGNRAPTGKVPDAISWRSISATASALLRGRSERRSEFNEISPWGRRPTFSVRQRSLLTSCWTLQRPVSAEPDTGMFDASPELVRRISFAS
jgi:hypothetical protein